MADGIKFDIIKEGASVTLTGDAQTLKHPVETYVTEYIWQNTRANVTIAEGVMASTHIDLDGNGEITKLEHRQADKAAQLVANAPMSAALNSPTPLKSVTQTIKPLEPKPDDNEVLLSRKGLLEENLKPADLKSLPKLHDGEGKELDDTQKIKKIEEDIGKFFDKHPFGKAYAPDGQLTKGELDMYKGFIAPRLAAPTPTNEGQSK